MESLCNQAYIHKNQGINTDGNKLCSCSNLFSQSCTLLSLQIIVLFLLLEDKNYSTCQIVNAQADFILSVKGIFFTFSTIVYCMVWQVSVTALILSDLFQI